MQEFETVLSEYREIKTKIQEAKKDGKDTSRLKKKILYKSISPVNNFRLLFDSYFQTKMGLLDDHSFLFKRTGNTFTFTCVDSILGSTNNKNLIDLNKFIIT